MMTLLLRTSPLALLIGAAGLTIPAVTQASDPADFKSVYERWDEPNLPETVTIAPVWTSLGDGPSSALSGERVIEPAVSSVTTYGPPSPPPFAGQIQPEQPRSLAAKALSAFGFGKNDAVNETRIAQAYPTTYGPIALSDYTPGLAAAQTSYSGAQYDPGLGAFGQDTLTENPYASVGAVPASAGFSAVTPLTAATTQSGYEYNDLPIVSASSQGTARAVSGKGSTPISLHDQLVGLQNVGVNSTMTAGQVYSQPLTTTYTAGAATSLPQPVTNYAAAATAPAYTGSVAPVLTYSAAQTVAVPNYASTAFDGSQTVAQTVTQSYPVQTETVTAQRVASAAASEALTMPNYAAAGYAQPYVGYTSQTYPPQNQRAQSYPVQSYPVQGYPQSTYPAQYAQTPVQTQQVQTTVAQTPPQTVVQVVDRPVYIPQPVYRDRPVMVPQPVEKIVHVDRPVEKIVEKKIFVDRPIYVNRKIVMDRPVYINRPYPVDRPIYIEKKVPVPVHVRQNVPVDRPVYIEKKVPVPVERRVPVHVDRPIYIERKVPVPVQVRQTVPVDRPVYIEKRVPVPIPRPVAVHVDRPVYVEKPVPYPVITPASAWEQQMRWPQQQQQPQQQPMGHSVDCRALQAAHAQAPRYNTPGHNNVPASLCGRTPMLPGSFRTAVPNGLNQQVQMLSARISDASIMIAEGERAGTLNDREASSLRSSLQQVMNAVDNARKEGGIDADEASDVAGQIDALHRDLEAKLLNVETAVLPMPVSVPMPSQTPFAPGFARQFGLPFGSTAPKRPAFGDF